MLKDFGETYTQEEIDENRRLWIEALESGEYEQARGALRKNNGYCCLGVACKVLGANETEISYSGPAQFYRYDEHDTGLPERLIAALGMTNASGAFDGGYDSLIRMNDTKFASFRQIAEVLRDPPKGLFIERIQPVAPTE